MIKVVVLDRLGRKQEASLENKPFYPQIKKILKNKGAGKVRKLGSWSYNTNKIKLYGWETGKAGEENKHEIPPPYDTHLFFGDLAVGKWSGNRLVDFTQEEYDIFFEEMYGGFEDLTETDSDLSE